MRFTFFIRSIQEAILPRSRDEDLRRREFILNVLLAGCITLLSIAMVVDVFNIFFQDPVERANNSLTLIVLLVILGFFLGLYYLSRKGFVSTPAYFLVGMIFTLATYMGFSWGVDLPAAILFHTLGIAMAGILISTRFAFFVTLAVVGVIVSVGSLHMSGIVEPNRFWAAQGWVVSDMVVASILFMIIAVVSWLSNREIEKSLKRARASEAALMRERDLLEVRVNERTRELRQAQIEKMSQAYRFVEFGRLAGGLFHDLVNPLTALSMDIEKISKSGAHKETLSEEVSRAKQATAHMEKLMNSLRKHLAREGSREQFSVLRVLEEVTQILEPHARQNGVVLGIKSETDARTYGDPIGLTQVLTNLISNAIDAYEKKKGEKEVHITVSENDTNIVIQVEDFGSGMSAEVKAHLFEPFFTTKDAQRGLGIGLPLAKRIIEKNFDGTLSVESTLGKGSVFTLQFPKREP